jgi:hypothetical protein
MFSLKVKTFFKLLLANILVLFAVIFLIEICGQIYVYFNPGFKVLAMLPDKVLGWKFVPNFEMPFTGQHWYAREFSSTVKINSMGFRDFDRKIEKDSNVVRIVLLGDSMVAARQVNFEKTAAQLLEKRLNIELGPKTGKKFEVLNFGIDAFGLGQYYLTYENYARIFKPDFVFVYLFDFPFLRTINTTKCKNSIDVKLNKKKDCLRVRPHFTLTKNWKDGIIKKVNYNALRSTWGGNAYFEYLSKIGLFVHGPFDYDIFKEVQEKLIAEKLNGKRIVSKKLNFFNKDLFKKIFPNRKGKKSRVKYI